MEHEFPFGTFRPKDFLKTFWSILQNFKCMEEYFEFKTVANR